MRTTLGWWSLFVTYALLLGLIAGSAVSVWISAARILLVSRRTLLSGWWPSAS
jgi:hypothetical protein